MSVKKEASGRRSVPVEVEVPGRRSAWAGSTQSAAARRSAEAELLALITKFTPDKLGLIAAMRARGLPPFEAACAGVWLHGRAAEIAGPAMIADDLVDAIPKALALL